MILEDQLDLIKSHQVEAPVLVVPIANELGLEVFRARNWDDELSGMIKREEEDDTYKIYVNDNHHVTRRRFTIAHEISHFVLHKNLIGDGIVDDALYRSSLSNRVEAQANMLAAQILMPWHLLTKEINEGNSDISFLAELFYVSRSAMSIRLGVPYED